MDTMRERFGTVASELLDSDPNVAVVVAVIGAGRFADSGALHRHSDRVIDVGIREQLMMGVASGMALEGMRPIVHSYAPFLIERAFEQIKLGLGHQDVGAVLVSIGGSYDSAASGRSHQCPGDVALLNTLPGWHIDVPGHPDEVEMLLRHAVACDGRHYVRLESLQNERPVATEPGVIEVVRRHPAPRAVVVAVGPLLDEVVAGVADLPVTVLYAATVRPFDGATLRRELAETPDVVLVEPYLEGTSAAAVSAVLRDTPHRIEALGVANVEHRHYGSAEEHRAAHGLDAAGVRTSVGAFLAGV